MSLFVPATQPVNVGPAGVIVSIEIPASFRTRRLARFLVHHTAGSASLFSVEFSTDPLLTNPLLQIASYQGRTNLSRLDDDNSGVGFTHDLEERTNWSVDSKPVYVKIVPDAGTNNNFVIGIFGEPS